jgi:hypothetical protein
MGAPRQGRPNRCFRFHACQYITEFGVIAIKPRLSQNFSFWESFLGSTINLKKMKKSLTTQKFGGIIF